ncbi:MAG: hypothetical protein EOP38_17520 [Rubrivivax sp.]|nr:MAG: hypothetical protein EOP38_17520 [Rubrivivax sp.]
MPRQRNLVVLRAGRNSLHARWFDKGAPRNWDLYICPYQEMPEQGDLDLTMGRVINGPKWTGLRELLNEWDGWRDYDQVWLPDDDILASQESINLLFDMAEALSFDLCQPALDEDSYYAHYMTMRNRSCFARRVAFVEIMAPCFSGQVLQDLLPTFDETTTGWGWGLDSLWPKLLDYRNVGIIDGVTVCHTRPVGKFRDDELDRLVHEEADRVMEDHDCSLIQTTYSMIGPDLQAMPLSGDELTVALVDGWRYLFDANPAVLSLIVAAQAPARAVAAYPMEGTPAKGLVDQGDAAARVPTLANVLGTRM